MRPLPRKAPPPPRKRRGLRLPSRIKPLIKRRIKTMNSAHAAPSTPARPSSWESDPDLGARGRPGPQAELWKPGPTRPDPEADLLQTARQAHRRRGRPSRGRGDRGAAAHSPAGPAPAAPDRGSPGQASRRGDGGAGRKGTGRGARGTGWRRRGAGSAQADGEDVGPGPGSGAWGRSAARIRGDAGAVTCAGGRAGPTRGSRC